MLLKDCPAGSVVQLVSWRGDEEPASSFEWWRGCFPVCQDSHGKYVIDGNGEKRTEVCLGHDYQFGIIHHAPKSAPEPRITFTVGGQEFYVGQRVWSLESDDEEHINVGDEFVVSGAALNEGECRLAIRRPEKAAHIFALPKGISTTPPSPHEWKRGDWARHEDGSVYLVVKVLDNKIVLTGCGFADCTEMKQAHPRDPKLTFISHTEIPE